MTRKTLLIAALMFSVGATSYAADELVLKHRYSFDPTYNEEGIEIIKDSVGDADGTVYGGAWCSEIYDETTGDLLGTALILDGVGDTKSLENGSFVKLPPNIMQSASYSIETWAHANKLGNWTRLWDFGNCSMNEDGTMKDGIEYTMLAWKNAGENTVHSVKFNGKETQLKVPAFPREDKDFHHVVHTYDATTKIGSLYLDGKMVAQATQNGDPTTFVGGMPNMFIGKCNYASSSYFNGEIQEFRIYDGPMDVTTVLQNYTAGPDIIPVPQKSTGLEVVAEKTTISVKERTPITVYSILEDGTRLNVTTAATFSSADTSIATAANGAARGVAIGDVTINAQFEGASAPITISVVGYVPELTLQNRYSFNGNANDSVGGANGTLENGATISGGKLVLTPASNAAADAQTVSLPAGLFTDHMATTMEIWAQTDNQGTDFNNGFLYAFHNTPGAASSSGNEYFNLVGRISRGHIVSSLSTKYSTTSLTSSGVDDPLIQGELTHLVVVADGFTGKMSCYKDGRMFMEGNLDSAPMDLPTDLLYNKLGCSGYANDPGFFGKIDEFRIWKGAMTAEQVRTSYASGADTLPPTDRGELTALHITPRDGVTTITEDSKVPFTLTADYTNVKNVLLSATDATVTSSVTDVVNILIDGNQGYLEGRIAGKSTITATIDQISTTIDITVTERDPAILTHRYSFDNDVSDSVGHANGELINGAYVENGYVRIDGSIVNSISKPSSEVNEPPYVKLPANLISDHASVTIETWVTLDSLDGWARIYDFGCKSGASGTMYMMLAPQNNTIGGTAANFVTTGQGAAEQVVGKGGSYMATGRMVHVVVTVDSLSDRGCLYIDGKCIDIKEGISNNPAVIGTMDNCWLGRSLYDSDKVLVGNIHEFRTYKGVMSAKDAAINAVGGPETLSTEVGEFLGLRVVPSTTKVSTGGTIFFDVFADYENAKGVNFGSIKGVNISVDNPNITLADDFSITSNVNCTGNIVVDYLGKKYTTAVEFAEIPVQLAHRYSFNPTYGEEGEIIKDSVGDADGIVYGGALCMECFDADTGESYGNALFLDGVGDTKSMENGSFVRLPANIMQSASYSVEAWARAGDIGNWCRLWDFGNCSTNTDGTIKDGIEYTMLAWKNAGSETVHSVKYNGKETQLKVPVFPRGDNVFHYVVHTYDAITKTGSLYLDGNLVAQGTQNGNPTSFIGGMPNMFIGKCNYASSTYFKGEILEFRIWDGCISPQQVQADYTAGPEEIGKPIVFKSIEIELVRTDPVLLSGCVRAIVWGYTDDNRVDITSESTIVCSDGLQQIRAGEFAALVPGDAVITATYKGISISQTFEVTDKSFELKHRYSFDPTYNEEGIEIIKDSIGDADGTVYGNATCSKVYDETTGALVGTALILDGEGDTKSLENGSFVRLPANIMQSASYSIETWVHAGKLGNWTRVWDFGNCSTNADGTMKDGIEYTMLAWKNAGENTVHSVKFNGKETQLKVPAFPREDKDFHHVVHTYDATTKIGSLYLDGKMVAQATQNGDPTTFVGGMPNMFIGKCNYASSTYFRGEIQEFRIYDGFLTESEVIANFQAGPEIIPTPAPEDIALDFTIEDGELVLRWNGNISATAEVASTIDGPWTALEPAELIDGAFQIRIPITAESQGAFFRLVK